MIRTSIEENGALFRITLAAPRANILDAAMLEAIEGALGELGSHPALRGVLIDHEGTDFSFGASVEEHLPDQCEAMLRQFGRVIRLIVHCPVPVLVAVDGRCLGGAMELAMAGHLLFAHRDARLGQPEIVLGVFPPAAVALLPWRAPVLRRLILTGEALTGAELAGAGLVTAVTDGPAAELALDFFRTNFAPRSAFALRQVIAAVDPGDAFDQALYDAEQRYLQQLMGGRDPVEGLRAFLDRRKPHWEHA